MFKRVLYPTDFSDSASAALAYVKKLRAAGTEEVILLHVYDERNIDLYWEIEASYKEEPPEQVKHEIVKKMLERSYGKLKGMEEELQQAGLKTELVVVEGVPWREIVKVAEDMDVSLIVMGSHGERGLVGRPLGATAERVIYESPVPVLMVKPKD